MSAVFTGIDFSGTGKQLGYGHVVHSDNVHDGSVIPVPVAHLSSGPGPVVLLVAGTHGDEYEGQILLHELVRTIDPADLTGTLMIVPAANSAAVRAGTRVSPIDAGNLNRSYPGDARGGPTDQVANLISSGLLPRADFVIDLHSGGSNSTYLPSSFTYRGPDEAGWAAKLKAVRSLGLPYAMVVAPLLEPGSLSSAGDLAGIPTISTELSGAGTVDRRTLATMRTGMGGLLRSLGVLAPEDGTPELDPDDPVWLELVSDSPVTSTAVGLFEPLVDLGDQVAAGAPVAQVHFIDELDRDPLTLTARVDGMVAIMRRPTLVSAGTHLMYIAPLLDIDTV
ncbi:succinylglutamate desuccinylase/aspartoacylase domain-containing protein [Paeniglutamicibacter cryotolerans]|uniref:Putative deacylase n=1 Tax=Paeniglutamicibacter cryotolerans TaxID=670079 RepID=A0A839QQJ3_9MICC|nr:succinylglutamate desuccinylase/aspartoacylase family protein [Paeniglutamicibacter cryotolerans]MBB2994351.1 putative deacylase [Paeniglutamicibacter cryotolerans]